MATSHQRFVEKVVKEELDAIPEPCREKGPYLCYILRSVVAPGRTYSGSTNNFPHRIRQHNGIIVGGAVATKTSRPWRIAALVYGFETRSAALRYEFFTKVNHSKISNIEARRGKNGLQRRAALMMYAELKTKPEERKRIVYHLPDYYVRRCVEEARAAGVPGTLEAAYKEAELPVVVEAAGECLREETKIANRKSHRPFVELQLIDVTVIYRVTIVAGEDKETPSLL